MPSQPAQFAPSPRCHQERNEIRKRLKQKYLSPVPFRVTWTQFMYTDAKNHIVAMLGEFAGTFLFLFFAFAGTGVANVGFGALPTGGTTNEATITFNIATLLYISISFGFSLMVNAWIFYRISGGLFNPAVTLALALLGAISWLRGLLLFIVQIGAACFSAYIVSILFPTPFRVQTKLAPGTSTTQGVFIETICTAELVFTIIMLAKEKHRATYIAPVGIGLALFLAELVSVSYTGGSLNPARSLGPAIVTGEFGGDFWIYWVGPGLGTLLAVGFYALLKVMEYEMVNPGQDGDFDNDPTQNPDHEIARGNRERHEEIEEIYAIEHEGGFQNVSNWSLAPSTLGQKDVPNGTDLEAQ